ncbi:MAG: hypothetical protein IJ333_01790, partial [Clostridia bacterium]|nr:hypothetical protein [Clostridia bacterium]
TGGNTADSNTGNGNSSNETGNSGNESGNSGSHTSGEKPGNTGGGTTGNVGGSTGSIGGITGDVVPDHSGDSDGEQDSGESGDMEDPDGSEGESTPPSEPAGPNTNLTYGEYLSMSAAEQQAFFDTFASVSDFLEWCSKAKKEYEENSDKIVIEGGSIDLGEIMNGNS